MTEATRTELQSLKDAADQGGYTSVSDQLAGDIATLDSMDARRSNACSRKRKGKKLTDKDPTAPAGN